MTNPKRYQATATPDGYYNVVDTETGAIVVNSEGFTVASLLSYRLNGGTLGADCSELDEVAEHIENAR